jgi:hypothetical protein
VVERPAAALGDWLLIRRYAVPGWMIAEATEARERGDWRAACEAARVTVTFDDEEPVAGLLAGFAPDLLRWHLPRAMGGTAALITAMRYVLAPDGPITPETMLLGVRSPAWTSGSQRLTLHAVRAGDMGEGPVYPIAPHLWDARRAGELRAVARDTAGDGPDTWDDTGWLIENVDRRVLNGMDPRAAIRELRRLTTQFGRRPWRLRADPYPTRWPRHLLLESAGDRHRISRAPAPRSGTGPLRAEPCLHPALLRAPVDADLVRHGLVDAGDLHPLVRDALFPGTPPRPVPSMLPEGFTDGERVRVRCGAVWHRVGLRGGHLELLDHSADERRREHAMRAFGGPVSGCFQVEIAWHDRDLPLPKRLRAQRRDLWRRMEHGGSRVVHALLDAGLDPHLRDSQGRTLLHRIHQFEHETLLPRLLDAGLDVNALTRRGHTPMVEALVHSAPIGLVRALNEAGAYPSLSSPPQVPSSRTR